MYIRRKVFSVIEDENGVERYFSTTEFINEEAYLNSVQREFAEKEEKKKLSTGKKAALATAGTAAAATAAAYGISKGRGKQLKKTLEKGKQLLAENPSPRRIEEEAKKLGLKVKNHDEARKLVSDLEKSNAGSFAKGVENLGKNIKKLAKRAVSE